MNELITKQFENNQIRVITGPDGEPWFVGKDIAEALGYINTRKAIGDHCKHDVPFEWSNETFHPFETLDPQTIIIPERDVYRLIMKSKLPSAQMFEDWVVSDVLPSIRKTGSYSKQTELPDFTNPAEAARAWAEQFEQKQIAEQKVLELAPKAEFVDKYVESNGLFTLTAIAKNLKFKRKDLISKLIEDGDIFRRFKNLEPSARNVQLGYFEIKTGEANGHAYDQLYVTTKGRAWIAKSYVSELAQ